MSAVETKGWSVETFAAFWSDPDPRLVPRALTEDIVGYWTGRAEPVRGREDYTRCIAQLVDALPDVRIEVAEWARNGEFTFIRWIMHATGRHGPFEFSGIDRGHMRRPLVAEDRNRVHTAQL